MIHPPGPDGRGPMDVLASPRLPRGAPRARAVPIYGSVAAIHAAI